MNTWDQETYVISTKDRVMSVCATSREEAIMEFMTEFPHKDEDYVVELRILDGERYISATITVKAKEWKQ
jgi:hypothetical protein